MTRRVLQWQTKSRQNSSTQHHSEPPEPLRPDHMWWLSTNKWGWHTNHRYYCRQNTMFNSQAASSLSSRVYFASTCLCKNYLLKVSEVAALPRGKYWQSDHLQMMRNILRRELLFLQVWSWGILFDLCVCWISPCRKMVGKSLIAGLVVLLVAAASLFLGLIVGLGEGNTPLTSDHLYSKAAVAADAGKCSEVGRWVGHVMCVVCPLKPFLSKCDTVATDVFVLSKGTFWRRTAQRWMLLSLPCCALVFWMLRAWASAGGSSLSSMTPPQVSVCLWSPVWSVHFTELSQLLSLSAFTCMSKLWFWFDISKKSVFSRIT